MEADKLSDWDYLAVGVSSIRNVDADVNSPPAGPFPRLVVHLLPRTACAVLETAKRHAGLHVPAAVAAVPVHGNSVATAAPRRFNHSGWATAPAQLLSENASRPAASTEACHRDATGNALTRASSRALAQPSTASMHAAAGWATAPAQLLSENASRPAASACHRDATGNALTMASSRALAQPSTASTHAASGWATAHPSIGNAVAPASDRAMRANNGKDETRMGLGVSWAWFVSDGHRRWLEDSLAHKDVSGKHDAVREKCDEVVPGDDTEHQRKWFQSPARDQEGDGWLFIKPQVVGVPLRTDSVSWLVATRARLERDARVFRMKPPLYLRALAAAALFQYRQDPDGRLLEMVRRVLDLSQRLDACARPPFTATQWLTDARLCETRPSPEQLMQQLIRERADTAVNRTRLLLVVAEDAMRRTMGVLGGGRRSVTHRRRRKTGTPAYVSFGFDPAAPKHFPTAVESSSTMQFGRLAESSQYRTSSGDRPPFMEPSRGHDRRPGMAALGRFAAPGRQASWASIASASSASVSDTDAQGSVTVPERPVASTSDVSVSATDAHGSDTAPERLVASTSNLSVSATDAHGSERPVASTSDISVSATGAHGSDAGPGRPASTSNLLVSDSGAAARSRAKRALELMKLVELAEWHSLPRLQLDETVVDDNDDRAVMERDVVTHMRVVYASSRFLLDVLDEVKACLHRVPLFAGLDDVLSSETLDGLYRSLAADRVVQRRSVVRYGDLAAALQLGPMCLTHLLPQGMCAQPAIVGPLFAYSAELFVWGAGQTLIDMSLNAVLARPALAGIAASTLARLPSFRLPESCRLAAVDDEKLAALTREGVAAQTAYRVATGHRLPTERSPSTPHIVRDGTCRREHGSSTSEVEVVASNPAFVDANRLLRRATAGKAIDDLPGVERSAVGRRIRNTALDRHQALLDLMPKLVDVAHPLGSRLVDVARAHRHLSEKRPLARAVAEAAQRLGRARKRLAVWRGRLQKSAIKTRAESAAAVASRNGRNVSGKDDHRSPSMASGSRSKALSAVAKKNGRKASSVASEGRSKASSVAERLWTAVDGAAPVRSTAGGEGVSSVASGSRRRPSSVAGKHGGSERHLHLIWAANRSDSANYAAAEAEFRAAQAAYDLAQQKMGEFLPPNEWCVGCATASVASAARSGRDPKWTAAASSSLRVTSIAVRSMAPANGASTLSVGSGLLRSSPGTGGIRLCQKCVDSESGAARRLDAVARASVAELGPAAPCVLDAKSLDQVIARRFRPWMRSDLIFSDSFYQWLSYIPFLDAKRIHCAPCFGGRAMLDRIDVWSRDNFFTADGKGAERLLHEYDRSVRDMQGDLDGRGNAFTRIAARDGPYAVYPSRSGRAVTIGAGPTCR